MTCTQLLKNKKSLYYFKSVYSQAYICQID